MRAKMNDEDDIEEQGKGQEEESTAAESEPEPEFTIKHMETQDTEEQGEVPAKKTFWERIREKWAASCEDMKRRPWTYISIPIVAGLVGYITNYIGIKMLFYPINWRGIPLVVWPEQPFGLFGWQGIVPAKRFKMAKSMIDVTIAEFLDVSEFFNQLDPGKLAEIMTPTVNGAILGGWIPFPVMRKFLTGAVASMMKDIEKYIDIAPLAISGLTQDPRVLGSFF